MNLKNISIPSILILVLAAAVIVLLSLRSCENQKPFIAVNPDPVYITDTIFKGKYDSLVKVKGKKVPPKIVINWLPSEPQKIDSVSIIDGYLKLHPQGKPPIIIKNEFFTNHTSSPKLLVLNIIKDSLSITTFNPDATTVTNNYPIFLDNYGYNWQKGDLTKYDKKSKANIIRKNKLSNFYVNAGYDGFLKVPTTGIEYNLIPGKFKLDLDATVLIQQEPKLNLNAKLGYRLF